MAPLSVTYNLDWLDLDDNKYDQRGIYETRTCLEVK